MDNNFVKPIISENIIAELNLLLFNIPENITLLEKVRWLYIKVGEIFSYDYRISDDICYAKAEIDFTKDYINRYQTCTQISYLFNLMLNNIEGCKSRIIERKTNTRGLYGIEHVANEVTLATGEKLILDLTLDLYLIQSGCRTNQFGYTTDRENTYDIISLNECEKMDRKLGLVKNGEYTDNKIQNIICEVKSLDLSTFTLEEQIEIKVNKIMPIIPRFNGYHEGKQFINKLLTDVVDETYKEFNLKHKKDNEMELLTCFKIIKNDCSLWFLYDSKLGLIKTSEDNLKYMLNCGWETKSNTLLSELNLESKQR